MVAGFQVINDYGTLQIDETYKNLYFKTKGTVSFTTSEHPDDTIKSITYVNGIDPLLVLAGNGSVGSVGKGKSGTSFNFSIIKGIGTAARTIEYFIFDYDDISTPPNNSGLVIKDASNKITFHSDMKPLKILDVQKNDYTGGSPTGTFEFTYLVGRKIGVINVGEGYFTRAVPTTPNATLLLQGIFSSTLNNVVTTSSGLRPLGGFVAPFAPSNFPTENTFLMIDVTNY